MESILEELYLLGITDPSDKEPSSLEKVQLIKAVLNLYYNTFKEKTKLEELCSTQNSEIRKLKEDKTRIDNRFAAQEVLISNLKWEQKILQDKLNVTAEQLKKTKKEAEKVRLKWERWAQFQRISSNKMLNQLSAVKEELRIKSCGNSSNPRKPLSPVQQCQISMSSTFHPSKREESQCTSSSKDILEKALQRWDAAHRILVREGVEVCSSLQLIDTSLQESVDALKMHTDVSMRKILTSKRMQRESSHSTSQWIPLIVDNIRQNCLELSEIVNSIQIHHGRKGTSFQYNGKKYPTILARR